MSEIDTFWCTKKNMSICNECINDYGSCALFNEYEICIQQLNKTFLRSNVNKEIEIEEDEKTRLMMMII